MRDNYYRLGEGFLIVYSITMRDTFTDVNRFHDHILSVKGVEDVPLIVVGSKCDLDGDREVWKKRKKKKKFVIQKKKLIILIRCQRLRERRWPKSLMFLFSRHLPRREWMWTMCFLSWFAWSRSTRPSLLSLTTSPRKPRDAASCSKKELEGSFCPRKQEEKKERKKKIFEMGGEGREKKKTRRKRRREK